MSVNRLANCEERDSIMKGIPQPDCLLEFPCKQFTLSGCCEVFESIVAGQLGAANRG
jgi:hypothetical protein